MAADAGKHRLGPDRDRITLRTYRQGLASQAGHDLTIGVARWSGDLTVSDDGSPSALDVRIDLHSLTIKEGSGGVKPLTDRDRREIAVTARKVLGSDQHPEATFTAGSFEPSGSGGGTIAGTFTLRGAARPLRLQVSQASPGQYRATASLVQSDYGIKPYTGFFGALRVRDAVDIEIDVDLSGAGPAPGGT
jgi:polyisoprenoid-binding protein YceI